MCYREGCGIVPTDESMSIRNCGDAYDGISLGQTIAKFRGWPRDMVMQMRLWHIGVAEPPCEPRQIDLEHLSMSYRRGQPRKSMRMAMSRGRTRKSRTWQENIGLTQYRCCRVAQYGGAHSAALRSALLPFPASSLPRELVSGRHLPLPEAVGWPRPPYRTTRQTTCRLRGPSSLKNGVRKRHYLPRFKKIEQTG